MDKSYPFTVEFDNEGQLWTTVIEPSRAQEVFYSVEKAVREIRRAVNFRDGEVRVGLARRHFIPFLWYMNSRTESPIGWTTKIPFMGAEIFLVE